MARPPRPTLFDRELTDLPAELRWREWMGRVEAVIFAAPEPVPREALARVVGASCNLDLLIQDIGAELAARPYELVRVAGGYQFRTRRRFADAIRTAGLAPSPPPPLSKSETVALMVIAYFQPVTRAEIRGLIGLEVSRDTIAKLRGLGFVAAGPRSPLPGAPYTYVTTDTFLAAWGLASIRDLPDMERLEEDGLLGKDRIGDLRAMFSDSVPDEDEETVAGDEYE